MNTLQYLTAAQAANRLGLRPATMRVLVRRGLIKAFKFGRDLLFTTQAVADYERHRRPVGNPNFGKPVKTQRKRGKKKI